MSSGGLWRTWGPGARSGGLLADSGGLWRTFGGLADFWRTLANWGKCKSAGSLVVPPHARCQFSSISCLATPREDHRGQSVSQSAASSRAFPGGLPGGLLADIGGHLADFWRTLADSGGLLADFWRTGGLLADWPGSGGLWRTGGLSGGLLADF
eukprot:gene12121-biopygen6840